MCIRDSLRERPAAHQVSLWYLPMVLNGITFFLLALAALMMVENRYVSYLAAGILLTIVGVKRANIREDFTIRIAKRGILT